MKTVDNKHLPLKITHELVWDPSMDDDTLRAFLKKRLQSLADKGFGGVVTNVSGRNYARDPEEWRKMVIAIDTACEMGLRVWLYDEKGYPSGGAGGLTVDANPDYEAVGLVMLTHELAPGEIVKFTAVIWIEGPDPDCLDPLVGGQMKIDMNFAIVH